MFTHCVLVKNYYSYAKKTPFPVLFEMIWRKKERNAKVFYVTGKRKSNQKNCCGLDL